MNQQLGLDPTLPLRTKVKTASCSAILAFSRGRGAGYDVSRARGTPTFGTSLPFDLVDQTAKC